MSSEQVEERVRDTEQKGAGTEAKGAPGVARQAEAEALLQSILDLGRDRDAVPPQLYDDIVAFLRGSPSEGDEPWES